MNRYVSKTTNRFEFRFKNQTIQKFDICLDGFLTETSCNLQFKLKVTKIASFIVNVYIKNV